MAGRAGAAGLLCLLLACGDGGAGGAGGDGTRTSDNVDLLRVEQDARALVASAPLVVTAEVRELAPGRTTEGLEFQDVYFTVVRRLEGTLDGELVLEQPDPPGRVVSSSAGYAVGQRYLLFLRPSRTEAGRYVTVPQGRYRIDDGRLVASQPGPVADTWDGAALEQVLGQIERLTERTP